MWLSVGWLLATARQRAVPGVVSVGIFLSDVRYPASDIRRMRPAVLDKAICAMPKVLAGGVILWQMPQGCELSISKLHPARQGGDVEKKKLKGLILAQNERWRRGLGMQVERERVILATSEPY